MKANSSQKVTRSASVESWKEAQEYIAGGVNSPVRAFREVGGTPLIIREAKNAYLYDVDGNYYLDFCLSWGVFILGYRQPVINKAVRRVIAKGTSYGLPSLQETTLARKVHEHFPSMEKIRFVNSGTEAVMSAVRLARGFTRRNLIVKFDGCYHGHADHLLVSAGSGVAGLNNSSSAGIPEDFTGATVSLPYNDIDAVKRLFLEKGTVIAAVIVEPVAANMGVIPPVEGFLQTLREQTKRYGALLIFDEIITGFRVALGGMQEKTGIRADLTTLGKILGGGYPAAAFGGRADIMALLAPEGPVYQAGTLSGNPVAMSAGIATLQMLEKNGCMEEMEQKSNDFLGELQEVVARKKDILLSRVSSMFTLFFTPRRPTCFEDVKKADTERFKQFFHYMLNNKIYLSPSQFETDFLSVTHSHSALTHFIRTVNRFDG